MKATELVAWNLRRLRVARSVPQEILAADAEVDRSYVSRLERGLENPTVILLQKLADALDFHVSEFLREPAVDEARAAPLPGGRKAKSDKRRPS
jgi:transcriptional regulator with XRE-family HTH domain